MMAMAMFIIADFDVVSGHDFPIWPCRLMSLRACEIRLRFRSSLGEVAMKLL